MGFERNLILFLFEREREGYKRFADCTVCDFKIHHGSLESAGTLFVRKLSINFLLACKTHFATNHGKE